MLHIYQKDLGPNFQEQTSRITSLGKSVSLFPQAFITCGLGFLKNVSKAVDLLLEKCVQNAKSGV